MDFVLGSQEVAALPGGVLYPGNPVENPHGFRHLAEVGFGLLYLWPQQHPFDVT